MPAFLLELIVPVALTFAGGLAGWILGKGSRPTVQKGAGDALPDDPETVEVRKRVHEIARKRFPELVR